MPLLKILSNSEITGFDSPPIFNHEERKKFFSLPGGLKQFWRKLRTAENQILFFLPLWIRFDRAAEAAAIDHRIYNLLGDEPRLSSHSFDRQIRKYAREAGIGHFHIHRFRHTFARIVAEESGSIIEAQEALGHKDIQTTQIYINRIKFKKDKHSRSLRNRIKSGNLSDKN